MNDSISSLISSYTSQYSGDNVLKNTPLASGAYKTFTDAMKINTDEGKNDASAVSTDIGTIASDATGFASDAVSAATDPLNFLITKGLGFLESVFTPLKQELQLVTGNPDTLTACAKKFDAVANSLNQLAAQVEQSASSGGQNWQGDAAESAGKQVGTTTQSITDTASYAGYIASLLQISGMVMQAAYDIVNGIIASVVEKVVVTWVAAQLAAAPSFGASEAAAGVATAAEVAEGVAQAGEKVEQTTSLLTKILGLLKKIMSLLKSSAVKKFMQEAKDGKAAGAGAKALEKVTDKDGKSTSQLFSAGLKNNLGGSKLAETARDKALAEVGLPGKDKLSDPSSLTAKEGLTAGANIISKPLNLGTQAGTAINYAVDPGATTAEENSDQHGS